MFFFGYFRSPTLEQNASRVKNALKAFANQYGHRIAGWYIDNVSGTTMNRSEPIGLFEDAEPGDVIPIEQADRLTRLDDAGWGTLRKNSGCTVICCQSEPPNQPSGAVQHSK